MDFNRMFSALKGSGITSGLPGGLAGGVIGGALMTKKGRKFAGSALKVGGLAAVGGLAYAAYKNYQKQGQPTEASPFAGGGSSTASHQQSWHASPHANQAIDSAQQWHGLTSQDFEIQDAGAESQSLVLIQAMIAAAGSDGHIDASERDRIFTEVEKHNLNTEEKATLFNALSSPSSIDEIARNVRTPALAAEVYAVSAATINLESPASTHYLEVLASRLGIPLSMKQNIDQQVVAAA